MSHPVVKQKDRLTNNKSLTNNEQTVEYTHEEIGDYHIN